MRGIAVGFYALFLAGMARLIADNVFEFNLAEPGSIVSTLSIVKISILIAVIFGTLIFFLRVLRAPGPKGSAPRKRP